ncbi:MAG TPA: hypothetical protein VI589_06710, partial [Vicinamibacteria bacterium]
MRPAFALPSVRATTLSLGLLLGPGCRLEVEPRLATGRFTIEFDQKMGSRLTAPATADRKDASPLGPFGPSETIRLSGQEVTDFKLTRKTASPASDAFGEGQRLTLVGEGEGLRKEVRVTAYLAFPNAAVFEVSYTNTSSGVLRVTGWRNNHYSIDARGTDEPAFWSFNGASYESRPDWILPVPKGFRQANYQGMNATDYGGGTPVSDVWTRDLGVGVGHLKAV